MPVDPYSQMAFVEILNILLTARHIVDVNRFLINRNTNPQFGSLSGYFRWSATTSRCGNVWNTIPLSASAGAYSASISGYWQAATGNGIKTV